MEKTIQLLDHNSTIDHTSFSCKKTDIKVYAGGTDILLFRGSNKIILPGAAFTARAHFDLPRVEVTPSYNNALNTLSNWSTNMESSYEIMPSDAKEKAYLFCVGTDGTESDQNITLREVDYAKWTQPNSLVPFKYVLKDEDLSDDERKKYYGRKEFNDHYAYYFKEFESIPMLIQRYEDGTPIDSMIYSSHTSMEVETLVELRLKITEDDCRKWFTDHTGTTGYPRINTISICTAWKRQFKEGGADDNSKYDYMDIRPLTKYNMPTEQLIEQTKGLDIIYQIYY